MSTVPQSAIDGWGKTPEQSEQSEPAGHPMLDAVTADLAGMDVASVPGGNTYRATVLWLARVIDKRGDDEGPSTTAKLADQLTKAMQLLTRKGGEGDGDDFRTFSDRLSTPSDG